VKFFNPSDYFSRSLRANPEGDPLPPQVVKAFLTLGHAQRDEPETAMGTAQEALGGGGMSFIIEHTGDLTHRMTHMLAWTRPSAGYGYVGDKVDKVLYTLRNRYGFAREHAEVMRKNAAYRKVEFAQYMARANAALRAYADAHRKLPVYNRAQWLAREAAVALGHNSYHAAEKHLTELEKMLDTEETWWAHATAHVLDTRGEPVLYSP
jgi:hypothetical protein